MISAMHTIRHRLIPAAIVLAAILFSSCVDVESRVSLKENGSGEATISYRVSRMMASLGRNTADGDLLPLPVSEADFRAEVGRVPGLELLSYERSEDEDVISIDARLGFASIDALNGFYAPAGAEAGTISLERSEDGGRWVQLLYPGTEEPVDPESREFLEAFFSDYDYSVSLTAPSPIRGVNQGEFEGSTAVLRIPIARIIDSADPIVWEVTW